jgi:hypothetical protein
MFNQRINPAPGRGFLFKAAVLLVALACASCAGRGSSKKSEPEIPRTIDGLRAAIEADRKALTVIVSQPSPPGSDLEDRAYDLDELVGRMAAMRSALTELERGEVGGLRSEPEPVEQLSK